MSDRPRGRPIDPGLGNLADAQRQALDAEIIPERAPKLRALAIGTLAELRKTPGDITGNRGPASTMLSGYKEAQDGGEGNFVWHPTSTDADNGGVGVSGRVAVAGVKVGRWHRTSPPLSTGRLLRSTVLTGTSLAVFPGTRNYRLRLWGGGGGGGGVINAACAAAGGGGAGSPVERFGNPLAATYTFALGAAGAGGSTAGGDGGNGGDSTFSVGGVLVTAPGGSGGKGDAAGTAGATSRARRGGDGGILSTNGTTNGAGAPGHPSIMVRINFVDTMATSGAGGSSAYGGGGLGHERSVTPSAAGNAAVGPAAGGGGAIDDGTAARAGGAGGAGHGILEEYA